MKITHNKVGQNMNLVDGARTEKSDAAKASQIKDQKGLNPTADSLSQAGAGATKVDVSSRAQEAKRIKELANRAPDVDMAKVEKFRKLIDAGQYKVDAKSVADKMVDSHLEMDRTESES